LVFPGVALSVPDKENWNLRRDGEHYTNKDEWKRVRNRRNACSTLMVDAGKGVGMTNLKKLKS
jgi:hypothetical protein